MAFLLCGFAIALKQQSRSWLSLVRRTLSGSTKYVEDVSMLLPSNTLRVQYRHNTLFSKRTLVHEIPMSDVSPELNRLMYLKPSINELTQSADVAF